MARVYAFLCGLFAALQFAALYVVLDAMTEGPKEGNIILMSLGVMLVSVAGRIVLTYFSMMQQTETGYGMVAEKRIHIGDRLRYIPMGYFNNHCGGYNYVS